MSSVVLTASLVLMFAMVAVMLLRTIAARRVQLREAKLKAHLDWINPAPMTSRKRGAFRR
jgi:hypothetical protein